MCGCDYLSETEDMRIRALVSFVQSWFSLTERNAKGAVIVFFLFFCFFSVLVVQQNATMWVGLPSEKFGFFLDSISLSQVRIMAATVADNRITIYFFLFCWSLSSSLAVNEVIRNFCGCMIWDIFCWN